MKTQVIQCLMAFLIASFSTVCAETPNEAAAAIHGLLTDQNYEELLTTRYTEWYKVEQAGIPAGKAVKKMSGRFQKQHEMMLATYEQLKTAQFTMSTNGNPQQGESGQVAEAVISVQGQQVPFKLYQMTNEKWGFHQ